MARVAGTPTATTTSSIARAMPALHQLSSPAPQPTRSSSCSTQAQRTAMMADADADADAGRSMTNAKRTASSAASSGGGEGDAMMVDSGAELAEARQPIASRARTAPSLRESIREQQRIIAQLPAWSAYATHSMYDE